MWNKWLAYVNNLSAYSAHTQKGKIANIKAELKLEIPVPGSGTPTYTVQSL
jgi:hypothetical protein